MVANAGTVDTIHRAERFSDEEWRNDLETNLSGGFYLVQSAFEALAASGEGRVVLISSVAAEIASLPAPGLRFGDPRTMALLACLCATSTCSPG